MYIRKNELIRRLVNITGKDRKEFIECTVEYLYELYESYDILAERKSIYSDIEALRSLGINVVGEKNGKDFLYYIQSPFLNKVSKIEAYSSARNARNTRHEIPIEDLLLACVVENIVAA